MRIQDEAPLAVVAVTRGRAWIVPDAGPPALLEQGAVAVIRGPEPYTVADEPGSAPNIVIDPGEVCRTPAGVSLVDEFRRGVRTWGNTTDGETVMLVGVYLTDSEVTSALLESLPQVVVLRPDEWHSPLVPVLAAEIGREELGQQVVLDRLLDLLLVDALRAAFTLGLVETPRWLGATTDPVVGEAVTRIQHEPAEPWTVASLARLAGVSRALFARRFHDVVGQAPITFVTAWRMTLAADLLRVPDATVGAVATAVGYGSPFTFSNAFKRHHGVSPRHYRDAARAT